MLNRFYGYGLITILIFLPVVLWLTGDQPGDFSSPALIIKAIGKAAALTGIAAYFLMPVLSMRHPILEKLFGGLDVLYKIHKRIGKLLFFIIWIHPIFLLISGLFLGKSFFNVWNWVSLLIITGVIAILVFSGLIAFAIYSHIKHQKWISYHRYFGWLIPLIMIHVVLANSRVMNNYLLKYYLATLAVLGFSAYLYRSVFGRFIKRFKYVVHEVNNISGTVTELVLKPIAVPLTYSAGQFAYLSIVDDAIDNEAHPFSFTTAPNGPYIRFAVKHLGDDTKMYKDIKVGSSVFLEGPYGHFSFQNSKNTEQIWIAGGVGITPFLSMARSLSSSSKFKIHLFYAAEEFEDAVFLRELFQIRKMIPTVFDITVVNRKLSGFVTIDLLKSQIPELSKPEYLICGPPPMLHKLKKDLLENKVPESHIKAEEFSML